MRDDEVTIDPSLAKAYYTGRGRTEDVITLIDDDDQGTSEIIGMIVSCVNTLSERMNHSPTQVCDLIKGWIMDEDG